MVVPIEAIERYHAKLLDPLTLEETATPQERGNDRRNLWVGVHRANLEVNPIP